MKYLFCCLLIAVLYSPSKAQGTRRDSVIIFNMLKVNIPQCLKQKNFSRLGEMLTVDFSHKEFMGTSLTESIRGKDRALEYYVDAYRTTDLTYIDIQITKIDFLKNFATIKGVMKASFLDLITSKISGQTHEYTCRFEKSPDKNWYLQSIVHYY